MSVGLLTIILASNPTGLQELTCFFCNWGSWKWPKTVNTLQRNCPATPQQSTSRGSLQAFPPCLLLLSTSSWYMACFLSLASSIRSSQGTVRERLINCLMKSNTLIISGQSRICQDPFPIASHWQRWGGQTSPMVECHASFWLCETWWSSTWWCCWQWLGCQQWP